MSVGAKVTEADLFARIEAAPFGEKTKALARRAAQVESIGGVAWGLFPATPVMVRGSGSLLYDADGKEYIDLLSGFSVSNFGNCHEKLTEAIRGQAGELTHFFDFPHPGRIRLAERLVSLTAIRGGRARVLFGTTGSDGIESAVRAVRYFTGKPYILTALGDYHGATFGTIGLTSRAGMNATYLPGGAGNAVGFFGFPHAYRAGLSAYGCSGMEALAELDRNLSGGFSPYADGSTLNVAAILAEPFQSSTGYYVPPRDYLRELRRICDKYGLLLIVDEVQTGLGRSGKLWAHEHSEIEPDILVTSKTLGGGLPLSAVVARAEILEQWIPTAHINTQAGNAVACAAGNAVLDMLEAPGFFEEVKRRGERFKKGLDAIAAGHPGLGYIDNEGLYLGLEFVSDPVKKTPAPEAVAAIRAEGLKRGLLLDHGGYYGNRIPLIPALNIPDELIDRTLSILKESMDEAWKKVKGKTI
ncbi:MAG: aspartate aminotransferase family protein [Clostridiales Family XIII bacterium]|jgi:4-aminobutyrate aminotransferase-like enzyme|nr:aspartate aminotransferase family protein [Clostridiales Family XIII bacterium]